MIYDITCSTDDNFLQHCMAMLCSVFENNKEHEVHVHMMVDEGLSEPSRHMLSALAERYQNKVYIYDIDKELLSSFDVSKANYNGQKRFPMVVYYRLLLQHYIPEKVDKILYLDCDIIVLHDLHDLFALDLSGYGLAAIRDASPFDDVHRQKIGIGLHNMTFCSGVMMINLDYWREHNAYQQFVNFFKRENSVVYLPDQDVLNFVFRDKWFMLPYKWGRTSLSISPLDSLQKSFDIEEYVFAPCIIHYSSNVKPWMNVWYEERKYYWKYAKLSGFPNPIVTKLQGKLKLKMHILVCRYVINKYVRPLVPDLFELILRDIWNLIALVVYAIKGPNALKRFLLKRWKQKYNINA